jgi:seryl-tRNA synthetase
METIADEFAEGKINRAQFNAMYKRYSEQRSIIERLLQRNPESDAWRQVMSTKGHTSFLRSHFEAQPLFYAVHAHQQEKPIIIGGKQPSTDAIIQQLLRLVWQMPNRPKSGVGRKTLPNGEWLILAMGEHAATIAIFSLEPSVAQARLVRDLHNDFERANQAALARNWIVPERMVFPQRALMEESLEF